MSLSSFFHSILNFFHSDKTKHAFEAALKEANDLLPQVMPVVQAIADLTPNRTDNEMIAAFQHFGVPFIQAPDKGLALLSLATTVLEEKVPAGTARSVIQTAIQAGVLALKANKAA